MTRGNDNVADIARNRLGYIGSTDLLTRLGGGSDFATDTCIRKAGVDPKTKTRYLEELAFEIVGEQSLKDITERAQDLSDRGVRRVLAIFVKRNEVREWSPASKTWVTLDPRGVLEDPTLACPLPIAALVQAADPESTVAMALQAKKNPVMEALQANAEAKGLREALHAVFEARQLPVDDKTRARIEACSDPERLKLWTRAAVTAETPEAVFDADR